MNTGGRLPRGLRLAVVLVAVSALAPSSPLKGLRTRDTVLAEAFGPDAAVERESAFLTDRQLERIRTEAGEAAATDNALVTRYVARRAGALIGTAYLDTHRVRTLKETVIVVLGPSGEVRAVEILSFAEPREYLPREAWLRQFRDRVLDPELAVKRSIHGITGATLSAHSVTQAVRRVLATHQVLETPDEPVESDRGDRAGHDR